MIHLSKHGDPTGFLGNPENPANNQNQEILRQAGIRLNDAGIDMTRMSNDDMRKQVLEFQIRQIELELQNQELANSLDNYTQLYNSGLSGFLSINKDSIIQNPNQTAVELLGHSKEWLINRSIKELIYTDDLPHFDSFLRDIVTHSTNKILTIRLNIPRKTTTYLNCPGIKFTHCENLLCSGSQQFTYMEFRRAADNDIDHEGLIYLCINDITELKLARESIACLNEKLVDKMRNQTQELIVSNSSLKKRVAELDHSRRQLAEREAKLNSIFKAAKDGILTIDKSGTILSVNSAVTHIFGYHQDELIGYPIYKLIPKENRRKNNLYFNSSLFRCGEQSKNIDGVHKDGTIVPLDISIAEFSIDGTIYYASILRDVSLRKRQEQEDRAHLDELAHVTRLGLMGEMASGIAHEVNQPLTAIANYTQACLHYIQAGSTDLPKLAEVLDKTHQQALRAGQIIHRMREFVEFNTNHRSTIDINNLINVSVGLCCDDLKHNNIDLRFKLGADLPLVHADSVQIEQILINLIRNSLDSLKTLPNKEGRLLTIETSFDGHNYVTTRVKDNGSGIDEPTQQKILKPFFTTKKSGMGMGLSISHSIIKAHDGVLSFNSKPGKGTTFYFTLPV